VVTHGHEDHIGALPYLLREAELPVYGTKLSLAFLASVNSI
jgi:ribonuclease J